MSKLISPDKKYPNKRLWSFIKGQCQEYSGISTINANGLTFSENSAKAMHYMHNLPQFLLGKILQYIRDNLSYYETNQCGSGGVASLLANWDPRKASGPDGIPARLLKELANDLAPLLTLIYQASLQQGCIPDEWKKALINPIYKNGDRSSPASYWPISLTCIVCKLWSIFYLLAFIIT